MTAAKDGVQGRRRLRIFAAAAALVLLCAVCVGGVSGAETYSHTYYVPADGSLADIVEKAVDVDRSLIIITEDYVIEEQVVLSRNYDITITNAPGVDVTIRGNADAAGSLFKIDGGTLIVKGNDDGGSLTITTNLNGRAFDVDSGAALNIYDGVIVYQCGFGSASSDTDNGGAVYVSNGGEFIMYGGLLLDNTGYKGGAVYVNNGGSFKLMEEGKGIITNNHALDSYGGGVYAENIKNVKWTGGDIKGNTARSECDNNENNIYPQINRPETEAPICVGSGDLTSTNGCEYFWSVKEAYEWMTDDEKNIGTLTIFITRDFTQGYIETWNGESYTTELDSVVIDSGISVNFKPSGSKNGLPVNLNIIDQMFQVSGNGKLIVGANYAPLFTISGKNEVNTVDKGGFININNANTASILNCKISDTKAKEGGAVYIKSSSGYISITDSYITGCTAEMGGAVYVDDGGKVNAWIKLIEGCTAEKGGAVYVGDGGIFTFGDTIGLGSGLIKGCTAEMGGAVYVGGGTFNVQEGATIDSSNDVYLPDYQVITINKYYGGYYGTIGEITLPSYEEGRKVVCVSGTYSTEYPNKFILNQKGNDGIKRILVLEEEGSTKYLVLKNNIEYQVIIPPSIEISESTNTGTLPTGTLPISVTTTGILSNQVVRVYIHGDFRLDYQTDSTTGIGLNYQVLKDGGVVLNPGDLVGEFVKKSEPSTMDLTAQVTDTVLYSGFYSDTLTFTFELGTTV